MAFIVFISAIKASIPLPDKERREEVQRQAEELLFSASKPQLGSYCCYMEKSSFQLSP